MNMNNQGWVSSGKIFFCQTRGLNWNKPVKNGKNQNAGIVDGTKNSYHCSSCNFFKRYIC